MTLIQRLILEAGTALIVVVTAYALLPVLLILINRDIPTKKSNAEEDAK